MLVQLAMKPPKTNEKVYKPHIISSLIPVTDEGFGLREVNKFYLP